MKAAERPRPTGRTAARKPKKTAVLLAQRIVSEIADGRLEPGTPLPPEREMLATYEVARGTLREALRFLEIQGVIAIKTGPGGGPLVAEADARHAASSIAMLLQLERAPFRAVIEARTTLEPAMAAQAALRIDEESLDELAESVRNMRADLDDRDRFLYENERFHAILAQASGNNVFVLISSSLNGIVDGTPLGIDYPAAIRESAAAGHARIQRAIAERNPERAGAAMAVHMADYASYVERFYPAILDVSLRWDQVE